MTWGLGWGAGHCRVGKSDRPTDPHGQTLGCKGSVLSTLHPLVLRPKCARSFEEACSNLSVWSRPGPGQPGREKRVCPYCKGPVQVVR